MELHRTNQNTIASAHPVRTRLTFAAKALLVIAVVVLGVLFAAYKLTTEFRTYDDEGYILLSLAHYVKHGHLYTDTFSQYGPFYFYAQGIFFQLLHIPLTHDTGRWVTLIYWIASGLLAAQLIYKLSKSFLLGCTAGLACIIVGSVLAYEPGHPQQLVLLLFMLASRLSLPSTSGRSAFRLFLLGSVGAALLFTKVNVGVFYIAALAHTLVCLFARGRIRYRDRLHVCVCSLHALVFDACGFSTRGSRLLSARNSERNAHILVWFFVYVRILHYLCGVCSVRGMAF